MKPRTYLMLGCALALVAAVAPASAQIITFPAVTMTGLQEVPPVPTTGTGTGLVTLNAATNQLSWNISFSGLTSAQTAAHFHTGAPGVSGPVTINIGTGNPKTGSAILNATQLNDLLAGNLYINIHTSLFGGGEIRGQVLPPPALATIVGTGCGGLTLGTTSPPTIGNAGFAMVVGGIPAGVPAALLFPSIGIAPAPLDIGGGCNVYLDLASALTFINVGLAPIVLPAVGGTATFPLPIGPAIAQAGLAFDLQALAVTPGGIIASNALSVTIGF